MEAHEGCLLFPSPLAGWDFSDATANLMDDMVFAPGFSDEHEWLTTAFSNPMYQDALGETSWWVDDYDLSLTSQQSSNEENSMSLNSTIVSSEEEISMPSLLLSQDETRTDRDLSVFHLLKAYGEAKAKGSSIELTRIIKARLSEIVGPLGTTMERLGHYLLQGSETRPNYLVKESIKNYASALRAFYEMCSYGRFAHFVANTAILESVPTDVEAIHIIDFDVGEGVQWPPLLAALGPRLSVRLTFVDHKVDDGGAGQPSKSSTKEQLCSYANSMGLNLKVDEMTMQELMLEKRLKKSPNGCKDWMVFNCMAGLPHMGVPKSGGHVMDFVRAAEELITTNFRSGILTYGGVCGVEIGRHMPYSDEHLLHSYALFESMEWHFPPHLSLARTAMECLFLGPCVSSSIELQRNWEGVEEACGLPFKSRLEGCRLSKQNFLEAEEMVRGIGSQYAVELGHGGNEIVLEWRSKPLVKVSAWR